MGKWMFILGILLVILLIAGLFVYFAMAAPSKPKEGSEIENPVKGLSSEEALLQFNETYVDFLVFAIGGWKLHNPPLSDETPKIKVIVDDKIFISEIIDGAIKTEKREIETEDIIITTTKQEITSSILSLDMKQSVKESVEQGKTSLELKASYTTLFSKGYLSLYKEMTGQSFTGSAVRFFRNG